MACLHRQGGPHGNSLPPAPLHPARPQPGRWGSEGGVTGGSLIVLARGNPCRPSFSPIHSYFNVQGHQHWQAIRGERNRTFVWGHIIHSTFPNCKMQPGIERSTGRQAAWYTLLSCEALSPFFSRRPSCPAHTLPDDSSPPLALTSQTKCKIPLAFPTLFYTNSALL